MKISEGDFKILEDTIRQEVHFQETKISMLGTFLTVSGYVNDYRKGFDFADIHLKGDVNFEGTNWVSNDIFTKNIKIRKIKKKR